jgi:hypothetical protein
MKRPLLATVILLGLLIVPIAASAAQIKAFVEEFNFSPPGSAELKAPLKRLLTSRLAGDGITPVEKASEADVLISGSYTQLGRIFSLDAAVKSAAGKELGTAFEQGEAPDGVIPSVGKVAAKLKEQILKGGLPVAAATIPATAVLAASAPYAETAPAPQAPPSWISQRLIGAQSALTLAGPELILTASGKSIRLYRREGVLKLVAEAEISSLQKIVSIDSVTDRDGRTLAFVSIVQSESAASRVYLVEPKGLKLLADNVPYLFRGVAPCGGPKRLYAQQLARGAEYFGDVFEASWDGKTGVELKNPIKMPRFANIFNFNMFRDQSGKLFVTAFSEGGYLIVYSDQGEELWRSDDKFGGSEEYFLRRDSETEHFFNNPTTPRFIDQRISVTDRGDILVPQNTGFFVVGNSRSYSKYSMVVLSWNGAALEERWRSKLTSNYLADYFYDPASRNLTLLEVAQREGVFGKGASIVKVIRPELP